MPKGDCFSKAIDVMHELLKTGDYSAVYVVHGHPLGQGAENKGRRFWHAWVETETKIEIPPETLAQLEERSKEMGAIGDLSLLDGTVITTVHDLSNDLDAVLPQALYYNAGTIDPDEVTRFEPFDVAWNIEEYRHAGPWDGSCPPLEEEDD